MKDIQHSFGPGEVDSAVQEGSFSELSRSGRSGPQLENGLEDGFDDQGIAVAGDLNEILASVGLGIRPVGDDHFVKGLVFDLQASGQGLSGKKRLAAELFGNRECEGSADPDDGQGGDPGRGSACRNGVFLKSHPYLFANLTP